jgi:hypothetical protein
MLIPFVTVFFKLADIDLRQKCIHLRHSLFAPILLLRHLFVQTMGIICVNKKTVRHDSEKENVAMEKYQKLLRGEISRKQYVCILSYKYQPLV